MLIAERRGRLAPAAVARAIELSLRVAVSVHEIPREAALGPVRSLADEQKLTVYDAAYLHLAMREGLPLATLDQDLRTAAERVGVPLVE